jgi:hypothetical protein
MAIVEPGYSIEDRVMRLEVQQTQTVASYVRMQVVLDRIDGRVDGRPSWSVVTMLTFLATLSGVLATGLFAVLTGH